MKPMIKTLLLIMSLGSSAVIAAETPASKVYIISPLDGAEVSSPVTIHFGLSGMGVAPAGVDRPNTGHHHLLIDVDGLPDLTVPVPANAKHRHFGGGQTEVALDLETGEHSLQLLMGDKYHIPHNPAVLSEKIMIRVK
ncbi:MAG: DUF4399 domain-containing protein [Pseudomonadales bacterium]|nr:DUF4399 domain-containing protein [Pseudomonadales bacterium]